MLYQREGRRVVPLMGRQVEHTEGADTNINMSYTLTLTLFLCTYFSKVYLCKTGGVYFITVMHDVLNLF